MDLRLRRDNWFGVPRLTLRKYRWLWRQIILAVAIAFCVGTLGSCAQPASHQMSQPSSIRLDYAYYNPISLVLKNKGWLEEELGQDNIRVEWIHSLGSNKALELLNSRSIDFGSTAGAAALLGKANGNPIKSIYVYSKPEWTALVARADSNISKVEDLKGKRVAVTRGTDPHIFLLRALDKVGLSEDDIELVQLQHADGKTALERGDVDAWAGLDPYMAQSELTQGSKLFFRDPNLNTYGILNVREEFAQTYSTSVERVLSLYEKSRKWVLDNPKELAEILAKEAKLEPQVAAKQLERTDLSNSVIGTVHKDTITAAGDVLKKSGIIPEGTDVQRVVSSLVDSRYIDKVVATR